MKTQEKTFMNASLRKRLSNRIEIFAEDYNISKETAENAISQLDYTDEYFCNLISYPYFSQSEIDAIIEINI